MLNRQYRQEKALVGAFSVIAKTDGSSAALVRIGYRMDPDKKIYSEGTKHCTYNF